MQEIIHIQRLVIILFRIRFNKRQALLFGEVLFQYRNQVTAALIAQNNIHFRQTVGGIGHGLRHTARQNDDGKRIFPPQTMNQLDSLLFTDFCNGAGIQDGNIGYIFLADNSIAVVGQHTEHGLRFKLIDLTA